MYEEIRKIVYTMHKESGIPMESLMGFTTEIVDICKVKSKESFNNTNYRSSEDRREDDRRDIFRRAEDNRHAY